MAERWQDYAIAGLVLGLPLSSIALSALLQLVRPVVRLTLLPRPITIRLVKPLPSTIRLKVPVGVPKHVIDTYELPEELAAGEWITGKIVTHNAGDATGTCLLFIHTVWDGMWYLVGPADLDPCYGLEVEIPEETLKMPEQDATIEMYATHKDPAGEIHIEAPEELKCTYWKVDDKKTH